MAYWFKAILLTVFPGFVLYWIAIPIFDSHDDADRQGKKLFLVLTVLLLPVFLAIVNYWLARQNKSHRFLINGMLIISCVAAYSWFLSALWSASFRYLPAHGANRMPLVLQAAAIALAIFLSVIGDYRLRKTASR
ncbi:MAG: hypothetical protein FD123_1138 [Bacteroidetes bacterium]|nr:MAG: hypothetical protein FD123_1138 [Bacteroidota bacterium]